MKLVKKKINIYYVYKIIMLYHSKINFCFVFRFVKRYENGGDF